MKWRIVLVLLVSNEMYSQSSCNNCGYKCLILSPILQRLFYIVHSVHYSSVSTNKSTRLSFNSQRRSKNIQLLHVSNPAGPPSGSTLHYSAMNSTNTSTRCAASLTILFATHTRSIHGRIPPILTHIQQNKLRSLTVSHNNVLPDDGQYGPKYLEA